MLNTSPKLFINGSFLLNNLSGIERYAFELIKHLDLLINKDEIGIIIPKNVKNIPEYKNIKTIITSKNLTSFRKWEQFTLPAMLFKLKAISVDFSISCSFFRPGISFLYDIHCELFPQDFISRRERLERLYFRILYRIIASRSKKIITISNFSRYQISSAFHIELSKISIVYCSYNHFNAVQSDYSIFTDFPALNNPFYFVLGSLSKRKNIKWIFEYAVNHPDSLFAISGKSFKTFKIDEVSEKIPPNIIFLGFVDDSKVKALYERCKAFIQPSYYEGFGIPPLEALSCGAKIIISKASCLPEIYGNCAHYIDPFDTDIDLDELLKQNIDPPDELLKKYSIENTSKQLYSVLQPYL